MSDIESFAVFNADFPDDSSEDGNGNIITVSGRNILTAICEQIGSAGRTITQPKQHSFYGWASCFHLDKIQIEILLQQPGPWLLLIESRASWFTGNKVKKDALRQGVAIVNAALSSERRIKDLRWMTRTAFEALKRQGV